MKASKGIVRTVLFNIIGLGSLVALSACANFVTATPVATAIPTSTTASQNFAELAKSAATQGQFQSLIRAV